MKMSLFSPRLSSHFYICLVIFFPLFNKMVPNAPRLYFLLIGLIKSDVTLPPHVVRRKMVSGITALNNDLWKDFAEVAVRLVACSVSRVRVITKCKYLKFLGMLRGPLAQFKTVYFDKLAFTTLGKFQEMEQKPTPRSKRF